MQNVKSIIFIKQWPSYWEHIWTLDISFLIQAEEQMVDETDEQFEERVLNKRAYQMFLVVKQKFHTADTIILSDMCHRNKKKQVSN